MARNKKATTAEKAPAAPAKRKNAVKKPAVKKNGRFLELTGLHRKENIQLSIDPKHIILFHPHHKDPKNKTEVYVAGQADHITVGHTYAQIAKLVADS